jgi:mannosyltransferase OCH1-like enzyme
MAAGYKRGIFKLPEFSETEKVIKLNGKEKNLPSIPRIIWVYWEEDEFPEIVEGFISKLRRFDEGYVINVLSKNTLHKFLPSFTCHPEVPIANKTDLIRLDLLHKYGGVWLDITILLQENLSWLHHPDLENRYDLIGFYRDVNTVDEKYPVIETWFLASSAGNRFIKNWWISLLRCASWGARRFLKY